MIARTAHFRISLCLSMLFAVGLSARGCAAERARTCPAQPPAAAATQPAREFHLHLNGIGGYRAIDRNMIQGLRDGGYDGEVRAYDWTGRDVGLAALASRKRHREQAKLVADMLLAELRDHPGSRITVTAHSAGAGIISWALEQLPEGAAIDSLILLAPALSPRYDLSRALRHVRGRAFAFFSPHDSAVLGFGTRMFGTVDGLKVDASGKVGFTMPPGADVDQYAKLVQVPYHVAWAKLDHIGDHIGAMERAFARAVLAPVVLRGEVPLDADRPTATRPAVIVQTPLRSPLAPRSPPPDPGDASRAPAAPATRAP